MKQIRELYNEIKGEYPLLEKILKILWILIVLIGAFVTLLNLMSYMSKGLDIFNVKNSKIVSIAITITLAILISIYLYYKDWKKDDKINKPINK